MEKCEIVDQEAEAKLHKICEFVHTHRGVFQRQGSVVSSWRNYGGRRLGPFYSLRYRMGGRQTAIYLGRSVVLAERVKSLLREVQHERQLSRLRLQARAGLRKCMQLWEQELATIGLRRKGCEVRGWRSVMDTPASKPDKMPREGSSCPTTQIQ